MKPDISSKLQSGVTLVEMLVVVVMIGILMSIAVPSYRDYMIKANRADAKAALLKVASAQEKNYLQHHTYTTKLKGDNSQAPGALNVEAISSYEHYTIAISEADATGFIVTATAREGQTQDKDCPVFAMDEAGRKFGGKLPISDDTNEPECWGNR